MIIKQITEQVKPKKKEKVTGKSSKVFKIYSHPGLIITTVTLQLSLPHHGQRMIIVQH